MPSSTGTTAQSSGILRTHYSVPENVEIARRSWDVFRDFAAYVGDPEASCALVKCGYMIAAPEGAKRRALEDSVAAQRGMEIVVEILDREAASERLPIARFDDAALIAFEPEAGFADPYLVTQGFAKAARRVGIVFREGVAVNRLVVDAGRVVGVETNRGRVTCDRVVSAQNTWTREIERCVGMPMPVKPERHVVLALEATAAYTHGMPVFKDLASPGMLYCRSYGAVQMLVSEGTTGETLAEPDPEQGPVSLDIVGEIGAQVAERFPAYESAGLASSWTGVYDVTPDWNPVLGPLPGIDGLVVGFGFAGHGTSSSHRSPGASWRRKRWASQPTFRSSRTRSTASAAARCWSANTGRGRCRDALVLRTYCYEIVPAARTGDLFDVIIKCRGGLTTILPKRRATSRCADCHLSWCTAWIGVQCWSFRMTVETTARIVTARLVQLAAACS